MHFPKCQTMHACHALHWTSQFHIYLSFSHCPAPPSVSWWPVAWLVFPSRISEGRGISAWRITSVQPALISLRTAGLFQDYRKSAQMNIWSLLSCKGSLRMWQPLQFDLYYATLSVTLHYCNTTFNWLIEPITDYSLMEKCYFTLKHQKSMLITNAIMLTATTQLPSEECCRDDVFL